MVHLMRQAQLKGSALVGVSVGMAAAILYPMIANAFLVGKPAGGVEKLTAASLPQMVARDEVVLSDQPWLVAWYADRPSVWLPEKNERISKIRQQFPGARGLMLTQGARGLSEEWGALYSQMVQLNIRYMQLSPEQQKKVAGVPLPKKGSPVLENLDRFMWLPPREGTALNTVVAAVPLDEKKVGQRPGTGRVARN